jgi:hypothetical protein
MIRRKNNLNYEYYNQYLINCGSDNPPNMELLNDFFKEKIKYVVRTRNRTIQCDFTE